MPDQPVSEPAAETPPPGAVATGAVATGAGPDSPAEVDSGKFTVRLTNFTGPFDLLLQLIGKHKLDVTEIALHQVTDDFIAYIRAMGDDWDLGETSEFLLVAATLLDLKAARLLPSAEVEDEDDLALLEAGDLLFARLLQYKAYKEAAAVIADLEGIGARRWPRAVSLEPRYAEALPDLVLGIGPERLLKLALKQFLPKPGPPEVSIAHIHQVRVSVREHATLIRDRIRRAGSATFSLLIADCANTLEVVARFLALLELYREGLIDFEQPVSLEEMTVRWIGGDHVEGELDIDDYEGAPPEPDTAALDPDDLPADDDSAEGAGPAAGVSLPAADDEDVDDDADLDDFDVPDFIDFDGRDLGGSAGASDPAGTDVGEPADLVGGGGSSGAGESVDLGDLTEAADPVELADRAGLVDSVSAAGPVDLAGPVDPADSVDHADPVDLADPAGAVDPADPAEPANPVDRAGPAGQGAFGPSRAGMPPAGHTADRVSTDEEQS